ncbi:tRNA (adenosine(37)-N6)-dimethylallyltransferase MiaA [Bacillus sp. JCM 19034]|uniref:tRNA (adenosine(37)-N6)-dimethylallyltransferase MiaA n=1 Tax=Bacillus sp. JCM 19034 TaxID=1481928 RepID=UPI00078281BC|nr:tRNA (adenosine(37)-N6)-dimethylallyltransferase MiaA [Bacillus sp. JCM 19034]
MKDKLLVIVGPTAVGKTALSIELAKRYHGEIISGDSMQVYKGMDIGTAKATVEEQQGIPHHLIDIKNPTEPYSVADFQSAAMPFITTINNKKKVPILVGGTGLYVNAVIHQYELHKKQGDNDLRHKLEQLAVENGSMHVYKLLQEADPVSAKQIHPNNVRRVIRALELTKVTGIPFSEQQKEEEMESPYDLVYLALTMDRDQLYERINKRVDLMMEQGLLEEVTRLYRQGIQNCQSVQAIGYKELYQYLDGEISLEAAIDLLKKNSRHYAKRQLTWFRNKTDATWFDMSNGLNSHVFLEICQFIEGNWPQMAKYRDSQLEEES